MHFYSQVLMVLKKKSTLLLLGNKALHEMLEVLEINPKKNR